MRYSSDRYGAGLYGTDNDLDAVSISSWSFCNDGHSFVAVKLGTQGTHVFDVTGNKWLSWEQRGNVGLGFTDGQTFFEFCLMGSQDNGDIYTFDPEQIDDFSGAFETVVSGGVESKARNVIPCDGIYLSGNPSGTEGRSVRLLYSDDNGETWSSAGANYPVHQEDEISWRSLGLIKYPGRIFQIVDDGALFGIDGLTMTGAG